MTTADRGAAMAASVARTARSFGVTPGGLRTLAAAHTLAMEPRVDLLDDDHDPRFLHPGRTALILMRDVGVVEGGVLAAACLVESEEARFRIEADRIRQAVGDEVAEVVAAVPLPLSEALAEELVTAGTTVRLVALAERLDQLRHVHLLGADAAWQAAALEQAQAIYLPVAERTNERLAGRYRHWCRAFARRRPAAE